MFNFGKNRKIRKLVRRVDSSPNSKAKFGAVMDEYKRGRLYSVAKKPVKNVKQARAIAYHMAYGPKRKHKSETRKHTFLSKLKSIVGFRSH